MALRRLTELLLSIEYAVVQIERGEGTHQDADLLKFLLGKTLERVGPNAELEAAAHDLSDGASSFIEPETTASRAVDERQRALLKKALLRFRTHLAQQACPGLL